MAGTVSFSGSSTFSADFQKVISRAVGLASLPIQLDQNRVTTLTGQQSALSQINAVFSSLQSAIDGISAGVAGLSSVQVSDGTVLSAAATSAALNGIYKVQVDNLGSSTVTMSNGTLPSVSDPQSQNISSSATFSLTINGTAHTITPSGSSLGSLVSAINSSALGVQATLVNMGSGTSPSYRLGISSSNLGPDTIQLNDGTADLLTTLSAGQNVQYEINQSPTVLESTSRQITLSPGLTVNLLKTSATPVSVTVSPSSERLKSLLSAFATAYNTAASALSQHRGQNGGSLSGQSIVYTMADALRKVAQFGTGSGSVKSLVDLGLTQDEGGQMSFSASTFAAADTSAVKAFLGSSTGTGFLRTARDVLTSLTDPNTGALQGRSNVLQDQVKRQQKQITDQQSRVDQLQNNLLLRLSKIDALVASLQSQSNYYQQLFTAVYGKNNS